MNFSQWLASLNKENMVLMEINQNGLLPITDLILEENSKQGFKAYCAGKIFHENLREPTISIGITENLNHGFYGWTYLSTRFHDIVLFDKYFYEYSNGVGDFQMLIINYINKVRSTYRDKYKIKIVYGTPLNQLHYSEKFSAIIDFKNIDESKMKKFIHPQNGFTYLLYSEKGKRYGYSIHDDFILDTYGIRDWVEKLPTTTPYIHRRGRPQQRAFAPSGNYRRRKIGTLFQLLRAPAHNPCATCT